MGAQLNIKDAEVVELARHLAKQLDKSVTDTVREALQEKQRRREDEIARKTASIDALVDQVQASMPDETRRMSARELVNSLYDETQADGFAR